jgi:hypothetical protein
MALAPTPLSQVCRGLRSFIDGRINAPERSKVTVVIGTPADASQVGAGDSDHKLNLFFFRFEPSGLYPDGLPGETDWLRGFLLVTPFAVEEGTVGAGENDLRILGEVLRTFHEQPVLTLGIGDEDYQLQVILQPLALDQLNQLWSTQGETVYRPSALFEVSLVPVVPQTRAIPAPRVGALSLEVQDDLVMPATSIGAGGPEVPRMVPDIRREDWAPAIAFVVDERCVYSLSLALGSAELADFAPMVWLAGKGGARVELRWETWDAVDGWQPMEPAQGATIVTTAIDPDATATAPTLNTALPFDDRAGQMLLYAVREYRRAGDGTLLSVRSNPLLVSLYEPGG